MNDKQVPREDSKATPPFAALRAFEALGRLGGIRRSATALSLNHAVISRHIRLLEAWVGVPLIDRRRGQMSLTSAGQQYHQRLSAAMSEIALATRDLMDVDQGRGLLVSCNPGFGSVWLAERIDAFEEEYPAIRIDTLPLQSAPNLERRESDIDIRYSTTDTPPDLPGSLIAEVLASAPAFPVASTRYLRTLGKVESVSALLDATLLHEEDFSQWQVWFASQGVEADARLAGPRLWHANLAIDSARRGRGIALANDFLVGNDIAEGRLVDLRTCIDVQMRVSPGFYLLYARRERWKQPSIKTFRRWLSDAARMPDASCRQA